MNDREACIALNTISGIGYARFSALKEHFGFVGQAEGKNAAAYRAVPGINAVVADKLSKADWRALAENEIKLAEHGGVRILTLFDEAYPGVLRELHDPPLCLYIRGFLPDFSGRMLSVVGSRKMSRYGEGMTRALVSDAVHSGYTIISGLAYGVDTVAHQTTVDCSGTTIAVLGGGLLHVHPRENIPLAQNIVAHGGALVTEFPMDCPVSRLTFPRRNRIIAALGKGLLVVEAGLKSGALISAKSALELGRDIFAVPGQATNEQAKGCHQLIRDGAYLTESFDDIVQVLEGSFQPGLLPDLFCRDEADVPYISDSVSDLDPTAAAVLKNITTSGISLEELEACTGLDTAQLVATLMQLEFKFLIKRGGDMLYYPGR